MKKENTDNKFEEKIAFYLKEAEKLNIKIDEPLLRKITKDLGPSIYQRDAELVACSDPKELQLIKENFLIGKLGLRDGEELDAVVRRVCGEYDGKVKYRAVFYVLLIDKLNALSFKLEGHK